MSLALDDEMSRVEGRMLDAVILAVQGVLVPRLSFQRASIDAAATSLAAHGVPPAEFRRSAMERLATYGACGLVSRTLADMRWSVSPAAQRGAVLAARAVAPCHTFAPEVRHAIRALGARRALGFFDAGPRDVLERLLEALGLGDLQVTTLWAESLGREACAGRPLPFRWLSRRLCLAGSSCLHVATAGPAREAAQRAGWQVWPVVAPADGPLDLWPLVDWLDTQDGSE